MNQKCSRKSSELVILPAVYFIDYPYTLPLVTMTHQHILPEASTTYDVGAYEMQSAVPYRSQASSFRNF